MTAARKVDEQIALLERRGADVEWAPALSVDPNQRRRRRRCGPPPSEVLAGPVDLFLATTGIGDEGVVRGRRARGACSTTCSPRWAPPRSWPAGPKSVGALRRRGLRELWSPESECFEDVLAHLRGRDLTGMRIVVQEHGQSLSMVAHALRRQGADVDDGHRLPGRGAPTTRSRCSG